MDIDSKARIGSRLRFGAFCAFTAFTVYVFLEVSPLLALIMLPLVARFGARYIVHAAFDDAPYWIRKWMYREWHGNYYEFDGRQLRIDDFGRDMNTTPLIAVEDLENLFKDKTRFQIREPVVPAAGLLAGIPSIPADRAVAWARIIAKTTNLQADRARRLALYIERSSIAPRMKEKRLESYNPSFPDYYFLDGGFTLKSAG